MPAPATPRRGGAGHLRVFQALRHRNYRIYWFGFLTSIIGWQVQYVALSLLVYEKTGSALNLGFVSGSQAAATIAFSLLGGVIADRVDRRRLLLATQCGAAACSITLALLVASGAVELWHIVAVAIVFGSFQAFDQPTRAALLPHLIAREDMLNAVALTSAVWQSSRIIGPTIAGLLISFVGVAPCFFVTAGGFLVMVVALLLMRVPPTPASPRAGVLSELLGGLAYIRGSSLFTTLISMSFFNAVFGLSYVILIPVFALDILDVGRGGLPWLYLASGAGSLVGTFVVASLGDFPRKGLLILGGAVAFGALLMLFGASTIYLVSIGLLAVMGASTSIYMTSMMALIQIRLDDRFRGRVMGVYALTWSLMPLGGLQAGAITDYWGARVAVAIGGAAVILGALVAGTSQGELRRTIAVPARPA